MSDPFADHFRRGASVARSQSVFTNRVNELATFQSVRGRHLDDLAAGPSETDAPRTNIVHFYGIGGIGKSSLLKHLQQGLLGQDALIATETIDFDSPSAFDVEESVLRLRAAVGQLGVPCTAFDFALHFYWSIAHPGESIETYTAKHGMASRFGRRFNLASDMESSVMDIVSSVVETSSLVHGTTKLALAVTRLLKDRSRVKHAVAQCDDLQRFLDAATIEQGIGYLPLLLSWDLQQAGNPPVVIFWDTYEEVQERGRRQERIIQRLCYLMPNVFFATAGRNRLDWDTPTLIGELDYIGPACWPGLSATGDSASQLLVGDLSASDAETYLRTRLVAQGEAAIPPEVRSQIVLASGGWPLYLDLAAQRYQQSLAEGTQRSLQVEDLTFTALVSRIAADLSSDERAVLRGLALLESFDTDLARAAAGDVPHGAVASLLERDFVKVDPGRVWPMSVHPTLRRALRQDGTSRDSWTEHDWADAAQRVAGRFAERAAGSSNTRELRACLAQGLGLAHQFGQPTDWLSEVARRLAGQGMLSGIRDLGSLTSHAGALSRLCNEHAARSQLSFADAARAADPTLIEALSKVDRWWVETDRATALLNSGQFRTAAEIYTEVLNEGELPADLACHAQTMFALLHLKLGQFTDLVAIVSETDCQADSNRLLGDVMRYNARWTDASRLYERGLSSAIGSGDVGLERLYRAELALVDGWTGRADPRLRLRLNDNGDSPWGSMTHLIAQALFAAADAPHAARELLDAANEAAVGFSMYDGAVDVAVARCFIAILDGDSNEATAALRVVEEQAQTTGVHHAWAAVLRWWLSKEQPLTQVSWLGAPADAQRNWAQTIENRHRRTAGPRL